MINSKHMTYLYNLKRKGKMRFYGYPNQCLPVEDRPIDYMDSAVFKEMCNYKMIVLNYKENTSRYDKKIYDL